MKVEDMIRCEIVLEYESEEKAVSIYRSVEPENSGYVKGKLEGRKILFEVSAKDALSVSHTINDLLACVKAAESSVL
jgi:tRNA threonylcarbamoyladenosine modification (KEOPS) complex  Pcc1 subunit